jgi:hypothetical protein
MYLVQCAAWINIVNYGCHDRHYCLAGTLGYSASLDTGLRYPDGEGQLRLSLTSTGL